RSAVREIRMKIDVTIELLGQPENDIDMRFTILPTELVIGTPADDIRSHLDRISHQLKCSRRLQYSLLRKGDDLQIDQLCVLLSEVNESFDTDQALDRVHIRMASHGDRAVTHCHVHNLTRPIKDVAVFLYRFEDAGHANPLLRVCGPARHARI